MMWASLAILGIRCGLLLGSSCPTPKKVAEAVGRLLTLADGTRLEIAVAPQDAARLDALLRTQQTQAEGAV